MLFFKRGHIHWLFTVSARTVSEGHEQLNVIFQIDVIAPDHGEALRKARALAPLAGDFQLRSVGEKTADCHQ